MRVGTRIRALSVAILDWSLDRDRHQHAAAACCWLIGNASPMHLRQRSRLEIVAQLCAVILTLWVISARDGSTHTSCSTCCSCADLDRHASCYRRRDTRHRGYTGWVDHCHHIRGLSGQHFGNRFQFMMLALAVTVCSPGHCRQRKPHDPRRAQRKRIAAERHCFHRTRQHNHRESGESSLPPIPRQRALSGTRGGSSAHGCRGIGRIRALARARRGERSAGSSTVTARVSAELSVGITGERPELRIAITRDHYAPQDNRARACREAASSAVRCGCGSRRDGRPRSRTSCISAIGNP